MQAEEILIGCFVECQSIKKVGGRRSVEELYQALFFVSPVPPECFTERNENRACSQVKFPVNVNLKYVVNSYPTTLMYRNQSGTYPFLDIYFPAM